MAAEDDAYRDAFVEYSSEIAPIFARYLDMAIGGELRYGAEECVASRSLMPDIMRKYHGGHGNTIPRGKAWKAWKELREEMGTAALEQAEEALLNGHWKTGMGGTAWGNAAHLLLLYETNQIDPITFVDSAFGLEHNNGCIFNKRWSGGTNLRAVLDGNLKRDERPRKYDAVMLKRPGNEWRDVKEVLPSGRVLLRSIRKEGELVRANEVLWGMDVLLHFAPTSERRRYEAWRRYSHRRIR